MSNIDDTHDSGLVLEGADLVARGAQLPTVRKGGVDPEAMAAFVAGAAAALDSAHATMDAMAGERAALIAERDEAVTSSALAHQMLAGNLPPEEEVAGAASLLGNARQVAAATVADAQRNAEAITEAATADAAEIVERANSDADEARAGVSDARTEAAEIVARARQDAESEVAELRAEIGELEQRKAEEAASLDAQLEAFRGAALEAHQRAAGSLHAALAVLDDYVSAHAPAGTDFPEEAVAGDVLDDLLGAGDPTPAEGEEEADGAKAVIYPWTDTSDD